jgi:hypothetical protein
MTGPFSEELAAMADETTVETTETAETKPDAQTPEEIRAELERTRDALKKANKEAAERRKKLDAYEKAEADRKTAELSETDRLKAERDDLSKSLTTAQADIRSERAAHAVELVALALDFHDPDDAMRPEVLAAVEFDEDGRVDRTSVEKALKALAKAKPHLVAQSDGQDRRNHDGTPPRRTGNTPKPGDQRKPEIDNRSALLRTGRYSL